MICKRSIIGLILSFLFLISLNKTFAIEIQFEKTKIGRGDEPLEIEADQLIFERERQIYQAHGKVELKRGNLFLKADHAQLNMITKEVIAWGNVLLGEDEDLIECERLEVNLDTKTGKITKAKIFLKDQNFHITGKEVEKLGENHYRVIDGSFTTCDGDVPSWKFTVKELEVFEIVLGGFGVAKGATCYVKNIPMLYLPIGVFPVRRERQTGFLLPHFGYSKKYGPEIKNAFYWAIAKNMDSTFYLDWLGDRGFKEGIEYRYAFTKESKGEARFYFINDQVIEKNRYAFFIQNEQKLPKDFYLKGNINYISDHEYQRDFDEDLPEVTKIDSRSRQQLRSDIFGGKNWDRFSLLALGVVYDDLTKESNDETIQKLPQLNFHVFPQSVMDTPLFFDLNSSYTHFWRERRRAAHRGDLFPKLFYPTRIFNVFKLETELGWRETIYRTYQGDLPSKWESRNILDIKEGASTEFYRVYENSKIPFLYNLFKMDRWVHIIEPQLSYHYSPRTYQKDLPMFDEVDRIPYTSQLSYGITQRLMGRSDKSPSQIKEYIKFKVYQEYSFGDPFIDLEGKRRSFSNIKAELWWDFNPYFDIRWDGEFNPYQGEFEILNLLFNIRDGRGDSFQTQYRFTKGNIKEANFNSKIKIIPPLYIFGSMRYNLLEKWRVENIYGAQYQAQCWMLGLSIEDKNRSPDGTQKKELKYQLYFNLLGIGSVGKKPL